MKLIGCVLFACLISSIAAAQQTDSTAMQEGVVAKPTFGSRLTIGMEGGYTRNYMISSLSNLTSTQYLPRSGYSIGLPVTWQISPRTSWLSVSTGLSLTKKNYEIARNGIYDGVNETFSNTYLQLPVMANFKMTFGRFTSFINVGGYIGYWAGARVKGTLPNILQSNDGGIQATTVSSIFQRNLPYSYSEKYTFDKTRDNRVELGWVAGLGISYKLSYAFALFAEGRITQSLTDQQKNYMIHQTPRYNQTINISVGCMVSIYKLRHANGLLK